MSQTRRLAAILAADVAGYSRLMGFYDAIELDPDFSRGALPRFLNAKRGRGLAVQLACIVAAQVTSACVAGRP